jgi:hypothetical protein
MLSKKEYFAGKSASPKWAKLSSAEKEQRYKSYRESREGQEKGAIVRRPNTCSEGDRMACAFVPGMSVDWPSFDRTPTLRRTHVYRAPVISNASGEAGYQVLPSFCGSSAAYVFPTPTFVAGSVSTWNAGFTWLGTTNLERMRVLGASVTFNSTLPALSDQGIVTAGLYVPGVSAADAPSSATEVLRCPAHYTGRNQGGFYCIIPPGSPEGVLQFNEKTQGPVIQNLGSRPGFVAIWTGLPIGITVGYIDLKLTVEESSATPTASIREMLSVPEPVPGALDALMDVISGFSLEKTMGAVKQTAQIAAFGRDLIASLSTPVLIAHARQYRALH